MLVSAERARHDHSPRMWVIMFNRSHRENHQRFHATITLLLLVRATYIWCCSSRIFHSWWTAHSAQRQPGGCNNIPSFFITNHTDRTFFLWRFHTARPSHPGHSTILLRSESPSRKCAKLHTVAASNNRDHTLRSLSAYVSHYVQSFRSLASPEIPCHDHSIIACSRHLYKVSFFITNHTDRTFFLWRFHTARHSHLGHSTILLRSESPGGKCAKLHTVAASNNRDHTPRSLSAYVSHYVQSFRSLASPEIPRHDHFIIACSRHLYKVSFLITMGTIWWGPRGTCPPHFFRRRGHNMLCPPTFFSLGFVFREVSKIKVMFLTFCVKSCSC